MAKVRSVRPVKLFIGLLASDPDILRRTRQILQRKYGEVDLESEMWAFTQTEYYAAEMGPNLQRWFIAFERPIRPDQIADVKLETNKIEQQITEDVLGDFPRAVNVDPGYLDLGKIVLATTKDRSHRIYLAHGIYAEVTLHYIDGEWHTWPWTYADYQTPHYREFFQRLRTHFAAQRQQLSNLSGPATESSA